METNGIYTSWRNKLLTGVSEHICRPCTDERKQRHHINYDNPLNCGCRCERVATILVNAKIIDENIERYSK